MRMRGPVTYVTGPLIAGARGRSAHGPRLADGDPPWLFWGSAGACQYPPVRSHMSTSESPINGALDPNRWRALIVIAIAQLMVVLDASIVNIALPSMQQDLGMTDANRQWVITAYTLAFGGLLLLGGRIADYQGRKRMFIVGLIGFAAASFLGGLSTTQGMLFGARALQGVFAALLAPAALSLISVTFTESKERARAFGVFGAISGGGADSDAHLMTGVEAASNAFPTDSGALTCCR